MAEPVRDRIFDDVIATLQTITQANGYYTTVADVRDVPVNPLTTPGLQFPCISVHDADEVDTDDAMNFETRRLGIVLEFWVRQEDGVPLRRSRNRLLADIYRALTADVTRGGLTSDTELKALIAVTQDEISEPLAGMEVRFELPYSFLPTDPSVPGPV